MINEIFVYGFAIYVVALFIGLYFFYEHKRFMTFVFWGGYLLTTVLVLTFAR